MFQSLYFLNRRGAIGIRHEPEHSVRGEHAAAYCGALPTIVMKPNQTNGRRIDGELSDSLSGFIMTAVVNDEDFIRITALGKIARDAGKIGRKTILFVVRGEDDRERDVF
jgi:hypothetical protein